MTKNYDSVEINHNPNCSWIPDQPNRILIIGGSGSGQTNVLLNSTKKQRPDNDKIYLYVKDLFQSNYQLLTGWPTKMSLFPFGNSFYKNKERFKIFSPQLLEVYRILLAETTLESIMFNYTFSVINTMLVPCT